MLSGERQWYATPVQRAALPGGRDIFIDYTNPNAGYHPGQAQAAYTVLPRFTNTAGSQAHPHWAPSQDADLERSGIFAQGVRAGPMAPMREGELYRGASVPPWGQPVWHQSAFSGFSDLVIPAAIAATVAALLWYIYRSSTGQKPANQNPEDNMEALREHLDTAWLNLSEARAHLAVLGK